MACSPTWISKWTRNCEPLNHAELFEYKQITCSPGVCDANEMRPDQKLRKKGKLSALSTKLQWKRRVTHLQHCRYATEWFSRLDLLLQRAYRYLNWWRKKNTLKLNQKIQFKKCFGLSQCVHITYLCLAVQNHPTGDHTIPLCSELCDVVAFVTMANEFWAQPEIEIEHKLSEWDYLGIHLAQFCYYDVYKTFYVTVDDNRRHSPNTVVSSGISSIKHFRSVSPIWKYNALHCTINASANNANVSFLLTIVAAASRELWEDTTWYFQFCLMPKVKWHQIQ